MRMKDSLEPWIAVGYKIFAENGPQALKIEMLAREVGKNKSSFYHHFVDIEIFTKLLLQYHSERAKIIIEEERRCQNIDPALFNVLLKYKQELLFHRQLLIHKGLPGFKNCFDQITGEGKEAILGTWAKDIGLEGQLDAARRLLDLSLENLFFKVSPGNITPSWFTHFFRELQAMVNDLKPSETQTIERRRLK